MRTTEERGVERSKARRRVDANGVPLVLREGDRRRCLDVRSTRHERDVRMEVGQRAAHRKSRGHGVFDVERRRRGFAYRIRTSAVDTRSSEDRIASEEPFDDDR